MTADDRYWQLAARVLTTKEYEALELYHRHGFSYRRIAQALGVTHTVIYDRVRRAHQKLAQVADKEPAA